MKKRAAWQRWAMAAAAALLATLVLLRLYGGSGSCLCARSDDPTECEALCDLYWSTWLTNPLLGRRIGDPFVPGVSERHWGNGNTYCTWRGVACKAGRVSTLYIYEFPVAGTIPSSIGNLRKLERLYLADHELTGTLPESLGNLAALEMLDVSLNRISGSLPRSLSRLSALRILNTFSNQPPENSGIEGDLPDLGPALEVLILDGARLSGTLPNSILQAPNIRLVSLLRTGFSKKPEPPTVYSMKSRRLSPVYFPTTNGPKCARQLGNLCPGCDSTCRACEPGSHSHNKFPFAGTLCAPSWLFRVDHEIQDLADAARYFTKQPKNLGLSPAVETRPLVASPGALGVHETGLPAGRARCCDDIPAGRPGQVARDLVNVGASPLVPVCYCSSAPKIPLTKDWGYSLDMALNPKQCHSLFTTKSEEPTWPPPKQAPEDKLAAYTINGRVPVSDGYRASGDGNAATESIMWTIENLLFAHQHVEMGECISSYNILQHGNRNAREDARMAGGAWTDPLADISPCQAIDKYGALFISGKRGMTVGSEAPWAELHLLHQGAAHVIVAEWQEVEIDPRYPEAHRLEYRHPKSIALDFVAGQFEPLDFAFSYSSLEHDGLGRYGDPINPTGDLESIAKVWCMLKPGGVFFIGVGVGVHDHISWNAHRVYGPLRLRLVAAGWEVLDLVGEDPYIYCRLGDCRQTPYGDNLIDGESAWQNQPVLVLRKPLGV